MNVYTTNSLQGWTCAFCRVFVPSGYLHVCPNYATNEVEPSHGRGYAPDQIGLLRQILEALERIERRLEKRR